MLCRSWRHRLCPDHGMSPAMPGKCRKCWRPCMARVDDGRHRCEECEQAIAQVMSQQPKLAMIREGARVKTLSFMARDPDPAVSDAAAEALGID